MEDPNVYNLESTCLSLPYNTRTYDEENITLCQKFYLLQAWLQDLACFCSKVDDWSKVMRVWSVNFCYSITWKIFMILSVIRWACLIYTFSLSFFSSFTFPTGKFTSSYICKSYSKWNDISNDWMLSVQMPFAVSQKR